MSDTIAICPLCHELALDSDDYGWSLSCTHDLYESVEPVEVKGTIVDGEWRFPLPDPEEWKATVGAEMLEKQRERAEKRAAWLALSCEERVAAREKQREVAPVNFMMGELLRDQSSLLSRQVYGEPETLTFVCGRCREAGCENTRIEPNPRFDPDAKPFSWGGFSVVVEAGSARRPSPPESA